MRVWCGGSGAQLAPVRVRRASGRDRGLAQGFCDGAAAQVDGSAGPGAASRIAILPDYVHADPLLGDRTKTELVCDDADQPRILPRAWIRSKFKAGNLTLCPPPRHQPVRAALGVQTSANPVRRRPYTVVSTGDFADVVAIRPAADPESEHMTGVLVHEWIAKAGGSENVFEAFTRLFPEADMMCLWNDSSGRFDESRLRETWLARTPLRHSKVAALPFMPSTWRRLSAQGYDWALISSHLFAHHARFEGVDADRRFVYVHSPARYIWTPELDLRGRGPLARAASAALRPLDRRRAQETRRFAANSAFVQRRVADTWGWTRP